MAQCGHNEIRFEPRMSWQLAPSPFISDDILVNGFGGEGFFWAGKFHDMEEKPTQAATKDCNLALFRKAEAEALHRADGWKLGMGQLQSPKGVLCVESERQCLRPCLGPCAKAKLSTSFPSWNNYWDKGKVKLCGASFLPAGFPSHNGSPHVLLYAISTKPQSIL